MSQAEILQALQRLSARAEARMRITDPCLVGAMGGAVMDFMTQEELEEQHRLKLMLPGSKELACEAASRIRLRLSAGNRGKNRT